MGVVSLMALGTSNADNLYVGSNSSSTTLNVTTGSNSFSSTYVGYNAIASNNLLTVGNTNTLLTNSADLYVGYSGSSNAMLISNGAMVSDSSGWIGYQAKSSNNTVLISGSNSIWANSSELIIGQSGSGNSLIISNEGQVTMGNGLYVGVNPGANSNSVNVTGSNTVLTIPVGANGGQDFTLIGYGGSYNQLFISNGATVNSLGFKGADVGSEGSSNATGNSVLITGGGSTWNVTNGLMIGFISQGSVTIGSGGTLRADSISIAQEGGAGVLNVGTLGGSDTNVTLSSQSIGLDGVRGVLNFNQADSNRLSASISGSGSINQLGSGSTILTGDNSAFSGLTTVTAGALIFGDGTSTGGSPVRGNMQIGTNPNAIIGLAPSASDVYELPGNISSDGAGAGILLFGLGKAILSGSNSYAGTTEVVRGLLLASSTNAFGTSTVNLGNSIFTVTLGYSTNITLSELIWGTNAIVAPMAANASLNITGALGGGSGTGTIDLSSYYKVGSSEILRFGISTNFTNSSNFSIAGGDTNWNPMLLFGTNVIVTFTQAVYSGTDLIVGTNHDGRIVDLYTNAFLAGFAFSNTYVGYDATESNGVLTVANTDTRLTNSGDLFVGYLGSGNVMKAANGASVANSNGLVGWDTGASNNTALVTGVGSLWTNSGNLFVGVSGSGNTLTIERGGHVVAGGINSSAVIGSDTSSSNNYVQVIGSGSTLASTADLYIGHHGSGNSMTLKQGGSAVNNDGWIGRDALSSNNSALVTGSGSLWSNRFSLFVGGQGSENSLVISNGGGVSAPFSNSGMVIGWDGNSSNNSVLVTGSQSFLSNSNVIIVGGSGSGNSLTVSNGGTVESRYGAIGGGSASNNTVLLTGYNSIWSNAVSLMIGAGSGNSLTFANQAQLTAPTIVVEPGALLNLGSPGGSDGAGGIESKNIVLAGAGALNFNQPDYAFLTAALTNPASMTVTRFVAVQSITHGNLVILFRPVQETASYTPTDASINQLGSGTSILVGKNAGFTGQTFIQNGALLFGYGRTPGASPVSGPISNNASLLFAPYSTDAYKVPGVISGSGMVGIIGTGSTLLSNSNSFSGGTTITGGKLITQNNSALGTGGVSLNGGTLQLNSILTISALNWTNSTTGRSQIALPNARGTNDYISVTTSLGLNSAKSYFNLTGAHLSSSPTELMAFPSLGSAVLVRPALPPTYTTNEFGVVGVSNYSLLISNNALWIEAISAPAPSEGNYMPYAQNGNQRSVAAALNTFIPATSGDRKVVVTQLNAITNNESAISEAFNAISPQFYQSLATIAFNLVNAQYNDLVQQMFGLRVAEGGGFTMSGMSDNTPVYQESDGKSTVDGKGVIDSKKDILRPGLDNHWGMFVDANGIFAQANSANMLPGYNSESGGLVTGLSYKWNANFVSGLYAGYEGSYGKYSGYNNGSTLIDNAVRFGLFGTYGQKNAKGEAVGFYGDGLIGGSYNNYSISRAIAFSGLNRTATANPGAGELDSMLAGGYNWKKGNWSFGPVSSLQYTYFGMNSFSENGAQSLDLQNMGWNSSSLIYNLGANCAYSWQATRDLMVVPQINLAWQHEFLQNPYSINAGMSGAQVSNSSTAPLRDTLYTGVGVSLEYRKTWTTALFYNAAAGNNNLESQNIFLSAGMKF
jgi:T5SS/PEP-CTERM-associated repeat protein/autotransporter-associated beta strand protein